MYVGPSRLIKKPRDKVFIVVEHRPANRTDPEPIPFQAIIASGNIHEPVGFSYGGKCRGFDPFSMEKPDRTDRASPGRPGLSLYIGLFVFYIRSGSMSLANMEKECISKIKENHPGNNKT
jgi:hypothetical protein